MKAFPNNLAAADSQIRTRPVYCYRFAHGDTILYFTNYDEEVVISGMPTGKGSNPQTFAPAQIAHKQADQTLSLKSSVGTISLAATDSELRKYFVSSPTRVINAEVYRINTDALPNSVEWEDDVYVELIGLGNVVSFGNYQINLEVASPILQRDSKVCRFTYQKLCNWAFGSRHCGKNLESAEIKLSTTASAVDRINRTVDIAEQFVAGNQITATTFQWGKLITASGDSVAIVASRALDGSNTPVSGPDYSSYAKCRLYLQWWPIDLDDGQDVVIYRGCAHTKEACEAYDNLPNFGGFPGIPTTNPTIDGISE